MCVCVCVEPRNITNDNKDEKNNTKDTNQNENGCMPSVQIPGYVQMMTVLITAVGLLASLY